MIKFLFGNFKILLSGGDFVIHTKIWNEVVSWDWIHFFRNSESMSVLSFSLTKVKIGHSNIVIDTEIWNKVVSWWRFWSIEGSS